jgi:hypothetical protein
MELVESWKDGEEVAVKRTDSLELPPNPYTLTASKGRIGWAIFAGCSVESEVLLLLKLTWKSYRQRPLGRTMGRLDMDRCDLVKSKRAESIGGSEEARP